KLKVLIEKFSALETFDLQNIENCVRNLATDLNIKAADLIHPIRVAVTGRKVGASLFETVILIGKEKTIERLKGALNKAK
ncbi:MAG: glutamate--tRNA ligase, partial [Candidatus Omnitrophota bacterium]|nr:glutamate--tRNA ligase [Candidatus Omnitrophota bacterium]